MTSTSKVPPHNVTAEEELLGGLIKNPDLYPEVEEIVSPEQFYNPIHSAIYKGIIDLNEQGITPDLVQLNLHLGEEVNPALLVELTGGPVFSTSILPLAKRVKKDWVRRQMITRLSIAVEEMWDQNIDPSIAVDSLLEDSHKVTTDRTDSGVKAGTLLPKVLDRIQFRRSSKTSITGVPTGFIDVDEMTCGFQPEEFIVLAARPSMGKTAMSLCMALNTAVKYDIPVLYYSLEMGENAVVERALSILSRVSLTNIRRGFLTDEEMESIYIASDILAEAPLFIDPTPALRTGEFRSRTRRWVRLKNVQVAYIDYLQLMRTTTPQRSREQEVAEISSTIKAVAKELKIPIVALAQLNRNIESRTDPRPKLSDLRESGAIEQDADIVMFIHRDKEEDDGLYQEAELIMSKQRNGPTGVVEIGWQGAYTAYVNHDKVYGDVHEY